jgi:hypothetical protein
MRRCKCLPIKETIYYLPTLANLHYRFPFNHNITNCPPNTAKLYVFKCIFLAGLELRPKGRGRPQRILTGSWPEDHVHGVIRAVVFRDPSSLPRHIDREDASKLTANRSAANSSMSRLLTVHPAHQQTIQVFLSDFIFFFN